MANKPIIITGCQRSGTTLFGLMLDSHPQVTTVDEDEFVHARLNEYLESPAYGPRVAFKLPAEATNFMYFGQLPDLKVVWCVRDPGDVIVSMLSLRLGLYEGHDISWATHDSGALGQIEACLQFIDSRNPLPGIDEYHRVRKLPPHLRTRGDGVLMGALCWDLKNRLPELYAQEKFPYMIVVYENLIRDPKSTMQHVLSFLELPWHDDVLRHHELHSGPRVGDTVANRPVDAANTGKWKGRLSAEELAIVDTLCAGTASRYGYDVHWPSVRNSALRLAA